MTEPTGSLAPNEPIPPRAAGDAAAVGGPVEPAIAVRSLRFAYPDGEPILDIDRFEVARRERVLVHGPSGGGKSTLLGLLAGVIPAQAGQVVVLGTDLAGLSTGRRDRFRGEHIGYIFQMFNLIPYLSVAENIGLPCRLSAERRARLGAPLNQAVSDVASRLGIGDLLGRQVTRLSVGQQQRVAAARALIGSPELVLADEPTSALDADHRARFLELLFESCHAAGSALVFVSHDRGLATHFDREVSMADIDRTAAERTGADRTAVGRTAR